MRVQVEFLGRVQKQEQDDAWYTCINYISVSGKPLYGFVAAQPDQELSGRAPHQGKPPGLLLRKVCVVGIRMAAQHVINCEGLFSAGLSCSG